MNTQFDKMSVSRQSYKKELNQRRCRIWQSLFILILFVACSPSNHTEFSEPFELSLLLKNHVQDLPGQTVQFQILDMGGEAISYGLLRLRWVEGGRMDFQTDQDGKLSMRFERDMLENEVMISAKSEDAKIRVTW